MRARLALDKALNLRGIAMCQIFVQAKVYKDLTRSPRLAMSRAL
jgi:hypothetical protein